MSRWKKELAATPFWNVWCRFKEIPPFKQIWSGYKNKRREAYMFLFLRKNLPHIYKKYASEPVDERKVVFMELRLSQITNSLRLLYQYFEANGNYDVHVHYLRSTFVSRREYDKNCRAFIRDIATAKYVIIDEGSNIWSWVKIRPETVVLQTWHGCGAFKKFGFSTADLIFGPGKREMLKYPSYANYTYVTLSSPEVVWAYEEAMNLQKRKSVLQPVGISRTDVFFDPEFIGQAFEKLYRVMPQSKGKKVILYAPTFRGRVADGLAPDKLDIPLFKRELGEEYVLLIKHHPLVRKAPKVPEDCKLFAMDVTKDMEIDDLLCVSDICISDYSSLVFEYSLFERPMLFFAYDKADYDDWRGFYYNYDEMTPGPVCTTNEEMVDYISNLATCFDKQQVVDFKNKFMRSCDGHATERILKLIGAMP